MDVEMRVIDGLTWTRRICELQQKGSFRRHICIIATTANARAELIKEAYNAGVDDVLPKHSRVKEILAKIEKHLDRGRKSASEG
jgi:CheY-like chemotaxis protein